MTVIRAIKKHAPGSRSRERQALAEAIVARDEAACALERGRAAVARAERLVDDAQTKLTDAVAAVADAREHQARLVAEAVSAGSHATPASALRAARAAETDAADDVDATKNALAQLQASLAALEEESHRAELDVECKINSVLAAAGFPLVKRLIKRRAEILELFAILIWMRNRSRERQGVTSTFRENPALVSPLFSGVAREINTALERGISFDDTEAALRNPILEHWEDAVAATRTDPDHELPEMRGSE